MSDPFTEALGRILSRAEARQEQGEPIPPELLALLRAEEERVAQDNKRVDEILAGFREAARELCAPLLANLETELRELLAKSDATGTAAQVAAQTAFPAFAPFDHFQFDTERGVYRRTDKGKAVRNIGIVTINELIGESAGKVAHERGPQPN